MLQDGKYANLTDLLPDFITAFLLLETECIVAVVTLRPHYQRLLYIVIS